MRAPETKSISFFTLLWLELVKLARRPMTWILALIFFGFLGLIYGSYALILSQPEIEGLNKQDIQDLILLPDGLSFGTTMVATLGIVVTIILASGSIASEFSWGTIRTLLIARPRRSPFLAMKIAAIELLALLLTVLGTLAAIVGSAVAGLAGDGPAIGDWLNGDFARDAAVMALRAFIAISVWAIISSEIAVVTHSLGAGIGVSLATYFIGDISSGLLSGVGRIGEYVSRFIPNAGVNALLALNQTDPPSYVATDWLWITANLAGYALLASAFATIRFQRMNILAASSSG